jgi:hypothetical protein
LLVEEVVAERMILCLVEVEVEDSKPLQAYHWLMVFMRLSLVMAVLVLLLVLDNIT